MVPASDLASETRRTDGLRDSLSTMTRLADRLAILENLPSRQSLKPKEVKDPEPFTGSQYDLKRFKNQLSLVLADAD